MGEIYRSAAITGVRRLDPSVTTRKTEKQPQPPEPSAQKRDGEKDTAKGQTGVTQQSVARASQEERTSSSSSGGEFESLRDLSVAQKQRIAQLEDEQGELMNDCKQLAEQVVALEQKLAAQTETERSTAYESGISQAQEELAGAKNQLAGELRKMQHLFEDKLQEHLAQVDGLAVEIAFAALSRLVGEHYGDPDFTKAVVITALQGVRGAQKLRVHVSPGDMEIMERYCADLDGLGLRSELEYVADSRVTVGGCLIETDTGIWDARLETQLQRLREAIGQAIREGQSNQ